MFRPVTLLLAGVMALPSPAFAADVRPAARDDGSAQLRTLEATRERPLEAAALREATRLARLQPARAVSHAQTEQRRQRNWIARHPALFGAAVGFAAGATIGFAAGDDGVLEDFNAGTSALFLGGILAGVGAVVGFVAGKVSEQD